MENQSDSKSDQREILAPQVEAGLRARLATFIGKYPYATLLITGRRPRHPVSSVVHCLFLNVDESLSWPVNRKYSITAVSTLRTVDNDIAPLAGTHRNLRALRVPSAFL
ncbi:MAG: hypothetical protein ACI8Z1_003526 [Candidatus Azotimanducaceae bacterium]|jgi:hypothetical protein